ncbi:MAG: metallophosphoesterase [Halodesulfurarchaeum sp.]
MAGGIDLEYADRAIYLQETETLVVADLHVGRVATSEIELPMGEREDLVDRLTALLDRFSPKTVVIAGDVLHSFGSIPPGVSGTVEAIRETIEGEDAEAIVLAGNHDTMLESMLGETIRTVYEPTPGTVVHHGHEIPEVSADIYVVGHEHPAIEIEGDRHPCFLDCPAQHDGARVLVLPAFNRFVVGTQVNGLSAADSMIPLLTDLAPCRPVIRSGGETLRFPPLESFRAFL